MQTNYKIMQFFIIIFVGFAVSANAVLANQPNYGAGITVDGNSSDWDLNADFFAKMYEAGKPDMTHFSNLYLRYNCLTNTMYALVLRENGWLPDLDPTNAWIKIYALGSSPQVDGNSGNDGTPPDFSWVYDGPTLVGYEASFSLAEGAYPEIEVHTNMNGGRTSSTGKKDKISLEIQCPQMSALDFGDAPDPAYCTLMASGGAYHIVVPGAPFLGINDASDAPDAEPNGQPDPAALGDDAAVGTPDDEDGVLIPLLVAGQTAVITFEVHNGPAYVDGWIDFNGNGVWGDVANEYIVSGNFATGQYTTGVNAPAVTIPANAVPGQTFARFRINSVQPLTPCGGPAEDGEVEDHLVTIEAPPPLGFIIIKKETIPDGETQSFEFSTNYGSNFFLVDGGSNNSGPLAPGTYSGSEINIPTGWTLFSAICSDGSDPSAIELESGETVTVTFTNKKYIDYGDAPDSYGTLGDVNPANQGASHTIIPGVHLGLSVDTELDGQPSVPADGDGADENGVTLPASLMAGTTITLPVDGGPSGGMLDAWIDFNGNDIFDDPAEHLWGGTSQSIAAGPNTLSISIPASAVPGATYARFRLSINGGLLPTGHAPDGEVEDYMVEIVAPGIIIVEKQTDPDGAPDSFEFNTSYGPNFSLTDDETNNSGPLNPGTYSVSEINLPAGWNLTSATCDDGSDPSAIGLEAGETVTVVFTNTQTGTIIIEKQTLPDGAPDLFEFNGDASGLISDGQLITVNDLAPGQYNAQELIPPGWTLTDISVDDGNSIPDMNNAGVIFNLEAGETVKATFTNTQKGTIIIEKQTLPDGSTEQFEFTGDASGLISDDQQIMVNDLDPGQYSAQELVPAGWTLTDISIDDPTGDSNFDLGNADVAFDLAAGETVKATFTNTQTGTIIIEKQTDPDGAVGSFEFSGDANGTISDNEQIKVENLIPGQYSSKELVPPGWELTSVVLDDNNSSGDVNTATANFVLEPGETVKAVFTNTLKVTEIEVEKDAEIFWERTYEWAIDKTVEPAEWHLFHGESGESQYTVTVTRSVLSDMVTVSGQICVTNTGQPSTSGLMYIDTLQYRTPQMNDWGVIEIDMNTPAAIPPGGTDCYNYKFTFAAIPDAIYRNVAVARITNFDGYEGQLYGPRFVLPVNLPQVPDKENNPVVNVEDSNGMQWEFTDTGSKNYNKTFLCDEHEGANGNTATIIETGQSASATVMVYCHELEIEKDAETSFNRYFKWMIDKEAEEKELDLKACTEDSVAYTVRVDTTGYEDADFMVKGTIKIHNPAPIAATINSLEDMLDGQLAHLDCQIQFPMIIQPGATFECGYQKILLTGEQLVNTATAVQQLFDYPIEEGPVPAGTVAHEGKADVIFTDPVEEIDECVTVTDTNVDPTLLGEVCAENAPKSFKYLLTVGPYYASGSHTIINTATYKTNDTGTEGSDSWKLAVNVKCVPPVANFEADIVDGISPLTVKFTDLSTNAIGWLWEFSDGTTSTEQNPVHVFRNPPLKYYSVKLTVWDCCEEFEDSMVKEDYIRVTKGAEVKFNASPLVVAPDEEVQFMNHCGGGVNWFEWNFGDGQLLKLRHNVMDKIHPTHAYEAEGSYTVSLYAYGQGGDGTFTVKDMIYVTPNYVNMNFVEGSPTLPNEPWGNAMNQDIITSNADVVALNKDAWAVFSLVDDAAPMLFDKVRILSNNSMETRYTNHLIKEFEIWVSMDNVTYEKVMTGTLTAGDMWKVFEFTPKAGKYVKLMVKSAQGDASPYAALSEIQLFGTPPAALALLKDVDGLDVLDWEPVTEFRLENAYPNPFNPSTTLQFALPIDAMVQLEVYNIRGQLVSTILNRDVPAGRYTYRFDAGQLNSGIYFYRFRAGKFQQIKRMTFLK